jgi:hypothetical protein
MSGDLVVIGAAFVAPALMLLGLLAIAAIVVLGLAEASSEA